MRFLVWGLGKSGKAAVKLLERKGCSVWAGDDRENPNLWREVLDEIDVVVLSPGIPPSHPLWREALRRKKEVIGELELAWRFFKGKAIAITGTDGKSTTTRLTYLILREFFGKVREGGNAGKPFSELLLEEGEEFLAVLEVSSFQGKTLRSFRPHGGAFVSFSRDHLDWHPSPEDYLLSKYRIFERQKEEDFIILNDTVPEIRSTPGRARRINLSELRIDEYVSYRGVKLFKPRYLKIKGAHNVYNAATASLIALEMGLRPADYEEVLYGFRGLPFRLEYLGSFGGVEVYNDSKSTTVNALVAALRTFPDGKVILILGGKDKGDDFSLALPEARKKVKLAIAIGETREKIKKSWEREVRVITADSLEEALLIAKEKARRGDVLLFSPACSSFDMFRNYEERGRVFSELVFKHFLPSLRKA